MSRETMLNRVDRRVETTNHLKAASSAILTANVAFAVLDWDLADQRLLEAGLRIERAREALLWLQKQQREGKS